MLRQPSHIIQLSPQHKRLHYLDSARGIAALSVITWHFISAFIEPGACDLLYKSPLHFFWYGEADVVFFFVHSGFILAYSYTGPGTALNATGYTRFLVERIFRIYPLFLFMLCLSYFGQQFLLPFADRTYTTQNLQHFWQQKNDWWSVLKQAILVVPIPAEGSNRLLPQDWTLTSELIAGAFVPLLGWLVKKSKWIFAAVVFVLIAVLRINTYIFEFACGILIFDRSTQLQESWQRLSRWIKYAVLALAIVLYTGLFYFPSLFNFDHTLVRPGIDRFIVIMGCCVFFYLLISSAKGQKWLSAPWLVAIGKSCYSIYLWHMLLLICFGGNIMHFMRNSANLSMVSSMLLIYPLFLAVTILLSLLSYRLIEMPFNKLGKRFRHFINFLLVFSCFSFSSFMI